MVAVEEADLVAVGGITVGGAMTASTMAGRRYLAELGTRRAEVEGKLALGATMRQATADLVAVAVAEALVPALDQTRTTGLVTLPGAFVGALFSGASPLQATRFQLVVLVGLLAAESVAAVVLLRLLATCRSCRRARPRPSRRPAGRPPICDARLADRCRRRAPASSTAGLSGTPRCGSARSRATLRRGTVW